jgi:hypothetical protein
MTRREHEEAENKRQLVESKINELQSKVGVNSLLPAISEKALEYKSYPLNDDDDCWKEEYDDRITQIDGAKEQILRKL